MDPLGLGAQGHRIQRPRPALAHPHGADAATLRLLASANRRHLAERGESDPLAGRIQSYELAARMQLAVPEATRPADDSPLTRMSLLIQIRDGTNQAAWQEFVKHQVA